MTENDKTALIIEDDDCMARSLSRALRRKKFEVDIAADIASARALLATEKIFDVILADGDVPREASGAIFGVAPIDLLEEFTAASKNGTRIVLISGGSMEPTVNALKNQGLAYDLAPKPETNEYIKKL